MLFILKLLLISFFGFVCSSYMPWWSLIIMSGLVAFMLPGHNFNAFLSGFLGAGLLWLVMAWKIDVETESIISTKIAVLFDRDDPNVLILMSGAIGALSGGLGAFTGNSFRQIFLRKKEKSFYS